MGAIIGMIEPDKVAFFVEMTGINGIFRKPSQRALQTKVTAIWRGSVWIDTLSMKLSLERTANRWKPRPSQVSGLSFP